MQEQQFSHPPPSHTTTVFFCDKHLDVYKFHSYIHLLGRKCLTFSRKSTQQLGIPEVNTCECSGNETLAVVMDAKDPRFRRFINSIRLYLSEAIGAITLINVK